MTDRYENIRRALDAIQAAARGHRHKRDLAHLDFREACDPDTIRALLAERDAAVAIVAELCSTREGMTMLAGLVCRKMDQVGEIIDAAIAAANGGTNG